MICSMRVGILGILLIFELALSQKSLIHVNVLNWKLCSHLTIEKKSQEPNSKSASDNLFLS